MTVSASTVKQIYTGDGTTTTFAIPFTYPGDFLDSGDVRVVLRDETDPANITEALQTNPTQYSISGTNVVMVTAPTATQKLLVKRQLDLLQEIDFLTSGKRPGPTYEKGLDKLTMLVQQLKEMIDRAILLKETDSASPPEFPAAEANTFIGWNAAGDDLENKDATELNTILGALLAANNLSDLANAATARTNLGLGTAAVADSTAFEAADPAIQNHLASTANPHGVTAAQVGNTTAQWNANQIQGNAVQNAAPADGQILVWSATNSRWEPQAPGPSTGGYNAQSTATIADGQTGANVTGMTIDSSTYSSAEYIYEIIRSDGVTTRRSLGRVVMFYDGTNWSLEQSLSGGDASGVTFGVTTTTGVGQVTYDSDLMGGTYSGSIKFARYTFS